ncbi:MAG: hypothetical protein PWP31_98 [Clostridia bacterium]|nr:hypothetical protein [Clostridia bacterium]
MGEIIGKTRELKSKGRRSYFRSLTLVVLIFLFISTIFLKNLVYYPSISKNSTVEITIPPGASTAYIADYLTQKGIVRNPLIFRLLTVAMGKDKELKPGNYIITPDLTLPEIVNLLAKGNIEQIKFTVPEGYTIKQIAELLEKKDIVKKEAFLEATSKEYSFDFLQGIPQGPNYLEGFLFPDTYIVAKDTTPEKIIEMMLGRFEQVYEEISKGKNPVANYSIREIVILASIVEREAKVDAERAKIAGVFVNRLKRGMKLRSCATVEYLLPETKPVLTYDDLEIESPYNTYKVYGLPPGPISNPGRASLMAALEPEETDYLYFTAKPDGTHYFSRTLSEHNQATARYQN